jgi:hypothetical protein
VKIYSDKNTIFLQLIWKYLRKIIFFSLKIAFVLFGPIPENVGSNETKFSFDIYYMIMLGPKKPPKEENEAS